MDKLLDKRIRTMVDELKGFITHEDTKFFVTKEDLKSIETKLDQLQKQINIKNILKGEDQNGK